MRYTDAQKARAAELVKQNGGVLDVATLDSIRTALDAPELRANLVHYWLKRTPKAKSESKTIQSKLGLAEEKPAEQAAKPDLTGKQQAFVDAYLTNGFNATEAAKSAGYSGDNATLRAMGYENLTKPRIRAEIERLLADRVMGRNEVLARLSDHAGGTLGDVLDKDTLSLKKAEDGGKLHLIKKVKITRRTVEGERIETVELELHDPQAALVQLGRHYKLFTDRTEIDMPEKLAKQMAELIEIFGSVERASEAFGRLIAEKARAEVAAKGNGDV